MHSLILGLLVTAGPVFSFFQANNQPHPYQPELTFHGQAVQTIIKTGQFQVEVSGDARLERIDENLIRLKSKNGHLAITLEPGEAIYGLTNRIVADRKRSEIFPAEVGGLDRRGEIVRMWETPAIAAYVPFYISSRGYGMLVEGADPGIYDIGKTDKNILRVGFDVGKKGFSCIFIQGKSYSEIMDRFTRISGRPILPPEWAFLPWRWRDECRKGKFAELDGIKMNADVVEDITMYEKLGLPVGVYIMDRPWAQGTYGYGNLKWDEERFPNGDAMVAALHKRGWRVVVWGGPWAMGDSKNEFGYTARKNHYLIGQRNIDYTNPKAWQWQIDEIEKFLRSSGVDGWKLDRADEYNPSRKTDIYFDGRTGFEVHNDYPRLFVKNFYDATRAVRGDDFVIISRPQYTGVNQWSIDWHGDSAGANFFGMAGGTDKGLRSVIISQQRSSVIGLPFWGSDTGGYYGFKNREVFARWLEFSAFSTVMEIGGGGSHEPWAMPTRPKYDEEMIKIYGRYTRLHARLADYTYALAKKAHETGDPVARPLVFDWPDDPKVANMWDEYLYGPSLLVAPVWKIGQQSREVYLPKGNWTDLWDHAKKYEGPATIKVDVPLDKIAVFIRADKADLLPKGLADGL